MSIAEKLKEHLSRTTPEEVAKDLQEIGDIGINGPTIQEYVNHLNKQLKSSCQFKCGMITIKECSHCGRSYENGVRV